ncbi:hypothetical protein EKH55_3720 [Sinorhizobium alkalisoli]|nr:hypothetical protein EKH55_3720 [Sinorhizobium alkalisoli]
MIASPPPVSVVETFAAKCARRKHVRERNDDYSAPFKAAPFTGIVLRPPGRSDGRG